MTNQSMVIIAGGVIKAANEDVAATLLAVEIIDAANVTAVTVLLANS